MTPPQLDRAKQLFAEAIDLPASEQAHLLKRAQREESPEVARHFAQLLADYQAAEAAGFLGMPAASEEAKLTVRQSMAGLSPTVDFGQGETLSSSLLQAAKPGPVLADDYEILDELGRGGMGTVYRAYQRSLNRQVAVKIIPTHLVRSPEQSARFYLEAEAAARLDHPGIVSVQEVGERNGVHYYTMQLVTGGSLDRYVGGGERLTRRRAAELIEAVSRAVQYAHDRAVIHRDIKPANILLDESGAPRLTDFGLAKFTNTSDQLTMTGQVMGTPSYMAPEQAEGQSEAISTQTDVYSLGATLYALLAGKPPFSGETLFSTLQQVQNAAPAPLPADVPLDLRTICQKCLEKSPADRYASAGDLADDLRRYLDGFPIAARRAGPRRRLVAWARRNPREAMLVGAVAATLLMGFLLSTALYLRAERNLQLANTNLALADAEAAKLEAAVEDTLLFASENLLVDAPGMQETRRTLLENARDYFEGQLAQDRLAPAKAADVHRRLGEVERSLGQFQAAEQSFDRAIEQYDKALAAGGLAASERADYQMQLAQVHREYAQLGQARMTLAAEDVRQDMSTTAGERAPRSSAERARGLELFARHAQRCLELRREVAESRPEEWETQRLVASAEMNLATARAQQSAQSRDPQARTSAAQLLDAAQQTRQAIVSKHPQPEQVLADLALGHEAQAQLSLAAAEDALEAEKKRFEEDALRARLASIRQLAKIPASRFDRRLNNLAATAWQACGDSYFNLEKPEKALECFEHARNYRQQMLFRDPDVSEFRLTLARVEYDLAQIELALGDSAASLGLMRDCQRTLAEGLLVRPDDGKPAEMLAIYTTSYAQRLAAVELRSEATALVRDGLQLLGDAAVDARRRGTPIPDVQQRVTTLEQARAQLAADGDSTT